MCDIWCPLPEAINSLGSTQMGILAFSGPLGPKWRSRDLLMVFASRRWRYSLSVVHWRLNGGLMVFVTCSIMYKMRVVINGVQIHFSWYRLLLCSHSVLRRDYNKGRRVCWHGMQGRQLLLRDIFFLDFFLNFHWVLGDPLRPAKRKTTSTIWSLSRFKEAHKTKITHQFFSFLWLRSWMHWQNHMYCLSP